MGQTLEEQVRDFRELGLVVIEDAIVGAELERLQQATDYWLEQSKADWLDRIATGDACPLWFDVPDPMEKEEIFIDMLDHPSYIDLLLAVTNEELIMQGPFQVRATPLWPVAYTAWHPDRARSDQIHPKMQIYINDVPEKGGEFAFVPGSHLWCDDTAYRRQRNNTMPGHVRLSGKAGTAILFDNAGLHTAMENETDTPRKSMIIGFSKGRHASYQEQFAGAQKWCRSSRRKQILGLEV